MVGWGRGGVWVGGGLGGGAGGGGGGGGVQRITHRLFSFEDDR